MVAGRVLTPRRAWIASAIVGIVTPVVLGGPRLLAQIHRESVAWWAMGIVFVLASTALVGPATWLADHPEAPRPSAGLLVRIVGVVAACQVPLVVFLLGITTQGHPRWRGDAPAGWLDVAPSTVGLALSPAVIWAVVAFYVGILVGRQRSRPWVRSGLFAGALAAACLSVILLLGSAATGPSSPWILAPIGTCVVYAWAWVALVRERGEPPTDSLVVVAALAAFSGFGAWRAMQIHDELPDRRPDDDCFIVTAAARGHACVVGRGPGSRQLAVFRSFEALLRATWPRFHARLRAIYGVVGPAVARHVTSAWRADAITLALLPAEAGARIALLAGRRRSTAAAALPGLHGEHGADGEETELHAAPHAEVAPAEEPGRSERAT